MAEPDALFLLVKSLSKSEKRAFVRFAQLQTPGTVNRYLALFNRICRMNVYDAALLKQESGGLHFEQLKQQLFRKVLQLLRQYHEAGEPEKDIGLALENARLLQRRGLTAHAEKELKKAAAMAEKAGLAAYAQIVFRRSTALELDLGDPAALKKRAEAHERFMKKNAVAQKQEAAYEKLFIEAETINKQLEATRNKAELRLIAGLRRHPLLRDERKAGTLRAKLLFHFIKGLADYLYCDFAGCARQMVLAEALLEKNELLLRAEEQLYVRAAANASLGYFHLERFTEAAKYLEKLRRFIPQQAGIAAYRDSIVFVLDLMELNRRKKYREAVALIESKPPAEEKQPGKTGQAFISQQETYLVFQQAAAYRGAGNIRKASQLIAGFTNTRGRGMKKDAYSMARIFFMLLRFDLNDPLLLESEIRAVRRFLKKENKLFLFEKRVLQFLDAMMTENSSAQIRRNFEKLKTDLQALKAIAYERNAFMYFDFLDWVERFRQQ